MKKKPLKPAPADHPVYTDQSVRCKSMPMFPGKKKPSDTKETKNPSQ